ncbi:hypothetical protein JYU34_007975 [Plutella xylostella]|uniref:Uncharacterized protein n=1 Tax=Plutella xylostella TaxID=51655 RepID=A0ABQ7QNJ2_PLUXY|nr:hypothetical protein JYU34_007975 [Plutella xylostella]
MDPKDKTNDLSEIPGCSHGNATPRNENKREHDDDESVRSREIATQLLDETVDCQATTTSRHDAIALLSLALGKEVSVKLNVNNPKMPVLIINSGSLSNPRYECRDIHRPFRSATWSQQQQNTAQHGEKPRVVSTRFPDQCSTILFICFEANGGTGQETTAHGDVYSITVFHNPYSSSELR